jgi:hypothetical protein
MTYDWRLLWNTSQWYGSLVFWDVAPCSHVEVDRPDDGGSKHLWNVDQLQRD